MEASSVPVALRAAPSLSRLALPAWIVLVVAALLLRSGGVALWDTVWAEDGTVFLQGALDHGPVAALAEPYAGYLHVPIRALAEIVVLFPPSQWALVLAVLSAVVTALLSAYVFAASASVLGSRWARGLAAALPILVGVGWEVSGSVANLHWYGLYAGFWALMARPESRRALLAAAAVVTTVALADPLVALMLPLALLQARGLRGALARRLTVLIPLGLALALQALATLTGEGPARFSAFHLSDVTTIYGQRVAGGALLGDAWFQALWHVWGWSAISLALAVAVLLVALAARLTSGRRRGLVLAAAAASVVYLLVPLVLRGTAEIAPQVTAAAKGMPVGPALWGSRYMLFPALALLLCLVTALDARGGVRSRAAFTALLAVIAISNMGGVTVRTAGPSWADGLHFARAGCVGDTSSAFVLTPPEDSVPWGVRIPCERLARR